jgi:hypothetical protein
MALLQAVEYFALARERESIRRKRLAGEPPPWTDDPILRTWRFTNVHRENDKTTLWLDERVRKILSARCKNGDMGARIHLVQSVLIFRWFNFIDTGERLIDLLLNEWDSNEARRRLTGVGNHRSLHGTHSIRSLEAGIATLTM